MLNAEDYILKTFQSCNIIGIGEGGHGLENSHEFFRKMFDNKKIQEIINVVIVEFANANYQDTLDKFIFGDKVDFNDLRKIWRETTSPGRLGELPIYFELIKKIRDINKTLSDTKKIRVLAGNPPIDWNVIHTLEDWKEQVGYRPDTFPAELAIEFGINQNKKVLVIYSENHLTKIPENTINQNKPSIASVVNLAHPNAMRVVGTIYSKIFLEETDSKNWPIYSVVDLAEDSLGNLPAHKFFGASLFDKNGKEVVVFDRHPIKDLFDALLYVGEFEGLRRCPMPEPDFDEEYLAELNRRRKIVGMKPIDKT